jgi:hypothetical protein
MSLDRRDGTIVEIARFSRIEIISKRADMYRDRKAIVVSKLVPKPSSRIMEVKIDLKPAVPRSAIEKVTEGPDRISRALSSLIGSNHTEVHTSPMYGRPRMG